MSRNKKDALATIQPHTLSRLSHFNVSDAGGGRDAGEKVLLTARARTGRRGGAAANTLAIQGGSDDTSAKLGARASCRFALGRGYKIVRPRRPRMRRLTPCCSERAPLLRRRAARLPWHTGGPGRAGLRQYRGEPALKSAQPQEGAPPKPLPSCCKSRPRAGARGPLRVRPPPPPLPAASRPPTAACVATTASGAQEALAKLQCSAPPAAPFVSPPQVHAGLGTPLPPPSPPARRCTQLAGDLDEETKLRNSLIMELVPNPCPPKPATPALQQPAAPPCGPLARSGALPAPAGVGLP